MRIVIVDIVGHIRMVIRVVLQRGGHCQGADADGCKDHASKDMADAIQVFDGFHGGLIVFVTVDQGQSWSFGFVLLVWLLLIIYFLIDSNGWLGD